MALKRHLVRRPSPALLVALAALFLAAGGPAAAVHAADAGLRVITGKQIRDNTVTSKDIRNGSLTARDFRAGTIPAGPEGPRGEQGPVGERGPAGEQGPQGNPGMSGYEVVRGPVQTAGDFSVTGAAADCPPGKKLLGGGAYLVRAAGTAGQSMPTLYHSAPEENGDGWLALWLRGNLTEVKVQAYAICANVTR